MKYGFHLSSKNWLMQLLLQSVSYFQKDCELASDRGMNVEPRYLRSSCTMPCPQRLICHHWNEECTPNCSFSNCCYEHICSLCTFNPEATDVHHKAVYCPYRLNQTRSRSLAYYRTATTCTIYFLRRPPVQMTQNMPHTQSILL